MKYSSLFKNDVKFFCRNALDLITKRVGGNSSITSSTDFIEKFGGKANVARMGQDLISEGKAMAASQNFDLMHGITEKYFYCKGRG